jgi:hypothetical protein
MKIQLNEERERKKIDRVKRKFYEYKELPALSGKRKI